MMLPILRPDLPRKIKEAYKLAFLVGSMSVRESIKVKLTDPSDCYDKAIAKIGEYDIVDKLTIENSITFTVRSVNNPSETVSIEIMKEIAESNLVKFVPMLFRISYNIPIDQYHEKIIDAGGAVTVPFNGYTILYMGDLKLPNEYNITINNNIYNSLKGKEFNYVMFKVKDIKVDKVEKFYVRLKSDVEVSFIKANVSDEPLIYSSYFNATEYIEDSKVCETYYLYHELVNNEVNPVLNKLTNDVMFSVNLKAGIKAPDLPIAILSLVYLNEFPEYAIEIFNFTPAEFGVSGNLDKINKKCLNLSPVYNIFIPKIYEGKVNVLISNVTKNNKDLACCIDVFGNVNVKYTESIVTIA